MTHPIVERRRAERAEKIALAREYIGTISPSVGIEQAWVVGSVARGDFNVWSDIDVVVVARELPSKSLARADLFLAKPPGLQIVAYTAAEFETELEQRNPLVMETTSVGVPIG